MEKLRDSKELEKPPSNGPGLLQRKLILLLRLGLLAPIETCSLQRDDPGCPGAGVFHAIVEEPGARDKMDSFLTAEWRSGQQLLQLFTTGCVCRSLTYLGAAAQVDRRDLQLNRSAKLIACVFRILQFLIEFAYFLGFSQKGGVSYES